MQYVIVSDHPLSAIIIKYNSNTNNHNNNKKIHNLTMLKLKNLYMKTYKINSFKFKFSLNNILV